MIQDMLEVLQWAKDEGLAVNPTAKTLIVGGNPILVFERSGDTVTKSLEEFAAAPYRTKQKPQFLNATDFSEYVGSFAGDNTVLFGSIKQANVRAVIDYDAKGAPAWGDHVPTLVSQVTPEWAAFKASNNQAKNQHDLADFLEQWSHVVVDPDAATICEIALNLEGTVGATFQSKVNRANGSFTFAYAENAETNQVKVPDHFGITVQPYFHSAMTSVNVRLRYRIADGSPKFTLVIDNPERIECEALTHMFNDVSTKTGKNVLVGP